MRNKLDHGDDITPAKYFLGGLLCLWCLTFPAKGIAFQLSIYLLPLSTLCFREGREMLSNNIRPVLIPLFVFLSLPLLMSELWWIYSSDTQFESDSFQVFWRLVLLPLVLAVLCVYVGITRQQVLRALVFAAAAHALIALTGIFFNILLDDRDWGNRIAGLASNPNPFGLFMGAAALAAIHNIYVAKNRRQLTIYGTALLLIIASCCYSGSRGAWLGFICGFTLFLFLRRHSLFHMISTRVPLVAISLLLFGIFILIMGVYFGLFDLLLDRMRTSTSISVRFQIWSHFITQVNEYPIFGKPIFEEDRFMLNGHSYGPHNLYLDVLLRTGLIGLICLLACIAWVVRILLNSSGTEKDIVLAMMMMLLVFCFFNAPFYDNEISQGIFAVIVCTSLIPLLKSGSSRSWWILAKK